MFDSGAREIRLFGPKNLPAEMVGEAGMRSMAVAAGKSAGDAPEVFRPFRR